MDLLFACDVRGIGGPERTAREWIAGLQEAGHTVRAVAPLAGPRPERGVYWRWRAAQRTSLGTQVARAIGMRRPDLVVTQRHGAPAALEAAAVQRIPGVLVVPSYESLCKSVFDTWGSCAPRRDCVSCPSVASLPPAERAALIAGREAHARSLVAAAAIVVPSVWMASVVRAWCRREAVVVLPVPAQLPPPVTARYDGHVLAAAVQWSSNKGGPMLPAIVRAVRATGPHVRAVQVTADGLDPTVREEVRAAGATLVEPAAIETLLEGASLTVVPSQWQEPFGRVAWESLARGVPVLASRSGGLPESVPASSLVAPRGDVGAWEAGVAARLGDTERWSAQAGTARAHAQTLLAAQPLEQLEALLRAVARR